MLTFDCPGCGDSLSFQMDPYSFKSQGPDDERGRMLYFASDPSGGGELVHVCDLDELREHRTKTSDPRHDGFRRAGFR